jgi:DNA-binding NarL/FixJ family response regulator
VGQLTAPIRLIVCAPHRLWRDALAAALGSDRVRVVAAVASTAEAAGAAARRRADICVVVTGPDAEGVDLRAIVAASKIRLRLVVLYSSDHVPNALGLRRTGIFAACPRETPLDQVAEAIHLVHAGHTVVAGGHRIEAALPERHRPRLTGREIEVLTGLARGDSTAALAERMGVRYSTARTHIQNLLTKLGVHSKVEAVAVGVGRGLCAARTSQSASRPAGAVAGMGIGR